VEFFELHFCFIGQRNAEIDYMLELAAQEEKEMRRKLAQDMKDDWENSIRIRKELKAKEKQDYIDSGGDALVFEGTDEDSADRKKLQQEQVRRWTQEGLDDAAYRKAKLKEEDRAYADLIRAIEEIREANANLEDEMRKNLNNAVLAENKEVYIILYYIIKKLV
jgi:hypothetical protein